MKCLKWIMALVLVAGNTWASTKAGRFYVKNGKAIAMQLKEYIGESPHSQNLTTTNKEKQQFPRPEMSLNGFSWDNSGQVFRAGTEHRFNFAPSE